jgi:O-antigen/teichoic acid export membrane protein
MNQSFALLRRNSVWLLSARLGSHLLALLFTALIAHRLSLPEFGRFALIAALVLIGNTVTTFGTDTLLIRDIAKAERVTALAGQVFTLQLILSALWLLIAYSLQVDRLLLMYSLSLFPLALYSVSSSLFRAFERMDLFSALNLVNGSIQCAAVFLSHDLWTLCLTLFAGNIIIGFVSYWMCSASIPNLSLSLHPDVRPLIRVALPFALLAGLSILSQRLGVLAVSSLLGDLPAGIYSAAARLVDGLKIGHYAVLGALLPALSRGAYASENRLRGILFGLLCFSVFLALSTIWVAEPIVNILFGAEYAPAVALLVTLVWTLVPYTISSFAAVRLVAAGQETILAIATAVSLAIFLMLYFWLISLFKLNGAIYASLIGEIMQAGIFVIASRQRKRSPA